MENTPTAPAEAPKAPESEAPQTTNTESTPAPAPNLHGFTEAQLAEMEKFYSANGGYEKAFGRVKSAISNPQPQTVDKPVENSQPQKQEEPTSHTSEQGQAQVAPQTPKGAITAQEFLAKQYFQALSGEEKYAAISKEIANGDYLKEMAAFGIRPLNPDGSINDEKVRMYLDLKAQTVPAKPTNSEPNASAAPTVEYVAVGDKIENLNQAYQVIMQPNHPKTKEAEEFIRTHFSKK